MVSWRQWRGIVPVDVVGWLEDRDRRLEDYLNRLSIQSVSVTSISQAIWTPAAHASTHASAGSDPVSPTSIGAYTTAQVDALDASQDALFWMDTTPQDDSPTVAQDLLGEQAIRIMESDGPAIFSSAPPKADDNEAMLWMLVNP